MPGKTIVLIPPVDTGVRGLDVIMPTPRGLMVRVSPAELQELQARGVPVAPLFDSDDGLEAAVAGTGAQEAAAALDQAETQALASLPPAERQSFGLA